jgi:6-phosphogluconolactonase
MPTVAVEVFADIEALARAAAERVAARLREAAGPRVSLGLAGGSTPADTYRSMRGLACQWDRVDAWLPDERWVPLDHRDSNGRVPAETLLSHVPGTFHRPRWAPWLEPEESAAHYEATLRSLHPADHPPDLILLGLGDDGHTASLFPETKALLVEHRWFVANFVPQRDSWRLTATFEMLHRARDVFFLVCGAGKAEVLARVMTGEDLPAARVTAGPAPVTWLLDRAAASRLSL